MILHVLDFVSAGLGILSLLMIRLDPRWWAMYGAGAGLFAALMAMYGIWGQSLVGLAFTSIACYNTWKVRHLFRRPT